MVAALGAGMGDGETGTVEKEDDEQWTEVAADVEPHLHQPWSGMRIAQPERAASSLTPHGK